MKESLWLASAVPCVILLILIVSYKLVLVQFLGVTGLFIQPVERKDPKGIGMHGQQGCLRTSSRAVFARAGETDPA